MKTETAVVLYGIKNHFFVLLTDGSTRECELKGKRLALEEAEYAPLACGDKVVVNLETSMIESRVPRENSFSRYNGKRHVVQTLGANVDQILCVISVESPPFLPQFLDRILVRAHVHGIDNILIAINKSDQSMKPEVKESLNYYKQLGYSFFKTVAIGKTKGLRKLKKELSGKRTLVVGQSGVGKSSLLNVLIPDAKQKVGEISERYLRGRHTTNFSKVLFIDPESYVIDTPGIKTLLLDDLDRDELVQGFPEIALLVNDCGFRTCSHQHEPNCAVKKGLEMGFVSESRYHSFVTLYNEKT